MWGSQPWNQWALQPSMFNNVPHDEIDWAELAKQWIQMQQSPGQDPPPGMPPLPGEQYPGPHHSHPPMKGPLLSTPYNHGMKHDSAYPHPPEESGYWHPEWEGRPEMPDRAWVPPPPPPPPPIPPDIPGILPTEKKTFDYGHIHDNPALTLQTVDYNHVSEQFPYGQVYAPPPPEPYDQYWSQVASAPPMMPSFLKKDKVEHFPAEEDITHIDAAKRKTLPAWIREGLEKMEQERIKRLQKEQEEKEMSERMKSSKKGLLESEENNGSSILMTARSKFDSDSENEDEAPVVKNVNLEMKFAPVAPMEDTRTEEEKRQELMMKVRRMLTEILLSVTNQELSSIAKEVHQRAIAKTPARQLASTSALRSIATGLNSLASYDSQSDSDNENDDDSTSEDELEHRIREKQMSFAIKEKKILFELEQQAVSRKELKKSHSLRGYSPVVETHPEESKLDQMPHHAPNSKELPDYNKIFNVQQDVSGAIPMIAPTLEKSHQDTDHPEQTSSQSEEKLRSRKGSPNSQKKKSKSESRKRESDSTSESESESTSSTQSSHSKRGKTRENGSRRSSSSKKHGESKLSRRTSRDSGSPDGRQQKRKKSRRDSSDSSRKEAKYRSKSKSDKKRPKEHHRSESESSHSRGSSHEKPQKHKHRDSSEEKSSKRKRSGSSPSRRSSQEKSSKHKRGSSPHRQRSSSHDWHKKSRKDENSRNRSRSMSRSRHNSSRSHRESKSHKRKEYSKGHNEDKKHEKHRHRSRSSSRTPKRYKRKSRSSSSDGGSYVKKSKIRTRDR